MDLDRARALILRELDALVAQLDSASDDEWELSVRCSDWTVRDLVAHCAAKLPEAADALRRMEAGISEPAAERRPPKRDRATLARAIHAGRDEFAASLGAVSPGSLDNPFSLSFVTIPGTAGLDLLALELGTHHNDLEWALGSEVPLPHDVVRATANILAGMLLYCARSAAHTPGFPVGYVIAGSEVAVSLMFVNGSWRQGGHAGVPTCVISGDDSALALFALGRIPADHRSLKVKGNEALASAFKRYFPGP
jgi:uncharacterized protein (TIGR03083 family)